MERRRATLVWCGSNPSGDLALDFPKPNRRRLATAADAVALPEAKPRAMREPLIVPSIGSQDIARAERPGIWHGEEALQQFDLSNGPFSVHTQQSSGTGRHWVKQKKSTEWEVVLDAEGYSSLPGWWNAVQSSGIGCPMPTHTLFVIPRRQRRGICFSFASSLEAAATEI